MNDELRTLAIRALIACIAVTWLVILWRADRNKAFQNFSFLGYITTHDGYPDRPATMEIGSWVALTMTLIVLVSNDRLTEWFALIYAGLPAIRAGQTSWLRSNAAPPAPGTVTTETKETKKVETGSTVAPPAGTVTMESKKTETRTDVKPVTFAEGT